MHFLLVGLPITAFARGFFGIQQEPAEDGTGVQRGAWNGSLLDNLNNQFQLRNVSLLLRSYCGQEIQRVLNNRTANLTFFAPSDQGLSNFVDMSARMGAAEFNCSTSGRNGSEIAKYCNPDQWPVKFSNNVTFYNISACSPLILQYHVIPDQRLNLTESKSNSSSSRLRRLLVRQEQPQSQQTLNVTVLETMLNDTRFVNLPGNQSQVLLLNQTSDGYYLRHGAWPDAKVRVNETINGVNGVAYIIDKPLMPPMNLTRSLAMLNLTKFSDAIQNISANGSFDNMTGLTVFAPIDDAIEEGFNASSYIIPDQVIYNNGSQNTSMIQSCGGQSINLTMGQNYTMQFGNATVLESNVLLSNGVLHILNGTVSSGENQGDTSNVIAVAC